MMKETMTLQNNSLNSFLQTYKDQSKVFKYSEVFPNYKVSAGVCFAAKMADIKWLIYRIFVYQSFREFRINKTQIWQMHRINDDHFLITCSNENDIIQIDRQQDKHFQFDYFKLIWVSGLLLLPSEIEGMVF